MALSDSDLADIASWQSIEPGFDRIDATIDQHITPILVCLKADPRLKLRTIENGGLSNYFSFLVSDRLILQRYGKQITEAPCVVVMLSLMTSVGVYGFSTFSEGPSWFGHPNFEPEQVSNPWRPNDWISAKVVAAIHENSPYRLIDREESDRLLPVGIEIHEYCLCAEPWNRVFHALFANTD